METTSLRTKFDRHYGTRRAKKRRDVCFALFGLTLLGLAVVGLDPSLGHRNLKDELLLGVGALCFVFLLLTLSFHLRYRGRE